MTGLLLGRANGREIFIEPFHTLLAGQTNLSGKTTTIIALAEEAIKKGFTVLVFDTKPTIREFDPSLREYQGFYDIPICYQPTTDPLVLIGLLEAKRRARLSNLYATLGRICERAKNIDDVIRNAELMEKTAKSGFIKDACYTLRDLLIRLNDELKTVNFASTLNLHERAINVMPINKLTDEAQQLVLKTAFEEVLRNHNRDMIVIVDEAYKFFPQDYGSACKFAGQKLITQGAKTKLFVWISTQFIAPTDKDPMKACPNKLFGRQDDSTEIEAIQKRVPGGRALKSDQLMTLKRGEFFFVPLEGKPVKVLVTPPWERALPKEVIADTQQIRGIVAELNETKKEVARLTRVVETYRTIAAIKEPQPQLTPEAVKKSLEDSNPSQPDIAIDHSETVVQIRHAEPRLAVLSTKTGKGQIMYALVNDLKGGPASMDQILTAMSDYAWTMSPQTFSPNTGGLVRDGYLVKDGAFFRTPKKVKIEVVKE